MGLEEIVARISGDADQRAAKMLADAKTEASKTVEAARERASASLSQAKAQAEREVREERLRSVAAARLAAKRELLQAREDVLRRYEAGIEGSIDDFVKSDDYLRFLLKAIEDGAAKIGEGAAVHVNARDKSLLRGKKAGGELSKDPIDCKGGALVTSEDGKRRVDNTIESILRERTDAVRLKLVDQVFGEERKKSASG